MASPTLHEWGTNSACADQRHMSVPAQPALYPGLRRNSACKDGGVGASTRMHCGTINWVPSQAPCSACLCSHHCHRGHLDTLQYTNHPCQLQLARRQRLHGRDWHVPAEQKIQVSPRARRHAHPPPTHTHSLPVRACVMGPGLWYVSSGWAGTVCVLPSLCACAASLPRCARVRCSARTPAPPLTPPHTSSSSHPLPPAVQC